MASKLFHAVVGVGITLGSVSACGGSVSQDEELGPLESDAGAAGASSRVEVDAEPTAPGADAGPTDASVPDDGSTVEADATSDDVIVAAFCDVTWPITKSGREVCGPFEDCEMTQAPWCFGPDDQGSCKLYPLECVGGEWQCMGNSAPTNSPAFPAKCQ